MRFIITAFLATLPAWTAHAAVLPPQAPTAAACSASHCEAQSPMGRQLTLDFVQAPLTTMTDYATLCLPGEEFNPFNVQLYVPETQQEGGPLTVTPGAPGCVTLSHFSMRQSGVWRLALQFNDDSAFFDLGVSAFEDAAQ